MREYLSILWSRIAKYLPESKQQELKQDAAEKIEGIEDSIEAEVSDVNIVSEDIVDNLQENATEFAYDTGYSAGQGLGDGVMDAIGENLNFFPEMTMWVSNYGEPKAVYSASALMLAGALASPFFIRRLRQERKRKKSIAADRAKLLEQFEEKESRILDLWYEAEMKECHILDLAKSLGRLENRIDRNYVEEAASFLSFSSDYSDGLRMSKWTQRRLDRLLRGLESHHENLREIERGYLALEPTIDVPLKDHKAEGSKAQA